MRSKITVSGSQAADAHVYRSSRGPQQIRFPSRRKIVKKYGRHDTTPSPKQQTLTQAGYGMPPLSDLHEINTLSQETVPKELSDGREKSVGASQAAPSAARHRGSKRRKLHHGKREPALTNSPYYTQTLTQLVSMHTSLGAADESNVHEFDGAIRYSEDEDVLVSSVAQSRTRATPQKHREDGLVSKKKLAGGFGVVANHLPSTPRSTRTEIPSSQPSPFTPMLYDRYHSPRDCQRPSPLSHKGLALGSPALMAETEQIQPRDIQANHASSQSKNKAKHAPSVADDLSFSPVPFQTLSQHFYGPVIGEDVASAATVDVQPLDSGAGTAAFGLDACHRPLTRVKKASTSKEIPDSDEEDGRSFEPYGSNQSAAAMIQEAGLVPSDHITKTATSLISSHPSSPLSSPLSSLSSRQSTSPTPLSRLRGAVTTRSALNSLTKRLARTNRGCHQELESEHGRSPDSSPTDPASTQNYSLANSQHLRFQYEAAETSSHSEPSMTTDTLQQFSQNLESQRVPLEAIRLLGPQTDRSDIIISIHPEQIRKIVNGTKDHEFRNFKIPHTVSRFWIYATRPVCELQYMAVVDAGFRRPGEIDGKSGIGNAEFNAGQLVAKFAYKLVQVYQLNNPVSLDVMKKNGWAGPPQRYNYLPPAVVGALLGNLRCALFEDAGSPGTGEPGTDPQEKGCIGHDNSLAGNGQMSISQEIEAQLLSDIAETQVAQTLQFQALVSSQGQPSTHVAPASTTSAPGPSQATASFIASTQDMSSRPVSQEQYAEIDSSAEHSSTMPRPGLDFEPSSIESDKNGSDERGNAARFPIAARRRILRQTAMTGSTDSTQAALPDSLYEEVRQAPPAIILDSEESDGGE